MKKVCAWCSKELHGVDSQIGPQHLITHGICENCRDNLIFQLGVELQVFLDSLKVPIVVVNQEGTIVTANLRARELLQKELPEIKGFRGGEVFECAYARLPEGCGNTIHCSGCTIRRTVMQTFGSGMSLQKVPAILNRNSPENEELEEMNLLISTEKFADLVLLRIDNIEAKDLSQQLPESDQ